MASESDLIEALTDIRKAIEAGFIALVARSIQDAGNGKIGASDALASAQGLVKKAKPIS